MRILLVLISLTLLMSCQSRSGQLVRLSFNASNDSLSRDSIIERAIHFIAETYPSTYVVHNSTEEDEGSHSISYQSAIYSIGDQTGFQNITVIDDDTLAVSIMRQLDAQKVRYSTNKDKGIWDFTYSNKVFVPFLRIREE